MDSPSHSPTEDPPRILIVEDDDTTRAMLCAWTHLQGWRFEAARTLEAARHFLASHGFDLLLSDITLPDGDGPQIVADIGDLNRGLPVVFLTGNPTVESAMASVRLRVVGYLVKPPDLDELRALMEREIMAHRHRRAVAATRQRVHAWDAELAQLEQTFDSTGNVTSVGFLHSTLRHVGGLLGELDRSVALLAATPDAREAISRVDLIASLRRTVQVLDATRFHFKSKELAQLRRELEALLRRMAQESSDGIGSSDREPRR